MNRFEWNHHRWPARLATFCLIALVGLEPLVPMAAMAAPEQVYVEKIDQKQPVRGQISLDQSVNITSVPTKISLKMRDANIRDVLNMVAKEGKFNIIMDKSVTGELTVDIDNVSINKVLEYLFIVGDLSYTKDGNTLVVSSKTEAATKNLNAKTFRSVPVHYKEALTIANQINQTLFTVPRAGGSSRAIAAADPDSNTILLVGTEQDIKLAQDALRELDVPRNRKVYQIKHSDPAYVATVLASSFFTPSMPGVVAGGGAAGGAQGAAGAAQPGGAMGGAQPGGAMGGAQGAMGGQQGGAMGGAQGGMGAQGGGAQGAMPMLSTFTTGGVTFIAEPVGSTLTIMGTAEQIALVDSVIEQVDIRRPQVSIEVSLVEVQKESNKSFIPQIGALRFGQFTVGLISGAIPDNFDNVFGWSRTNNTQLPFVDSFSVTSRKTTNNGRILANPNIVALDGTASKIEITDEVATINQTVTASVPPVITTTIQKEEAGITLDITPKVFNDGSVQLTLKPQVTQPIRQFTVAGSSTFLLASRSVDIAGVRVKDGQTLVIGGLIRESQSEDNRSTPILDSLPIVGAMFRAANATQKIRTELVLMVTPHILKEDAVPYFNQQVNPASRLPGEGSIQPVPLRSGNNQSANPKAVMPVANVTPIQSKKSEVATSESKKAGQSSDAIPLRPVASERLATTNSPQNPVAMMVQAASSVQQSTEVPKTSSPSNRIHIPGIPLQEIRRY